MDAKTEERLAVSKARELKEKMKQRRNTKATLKDIALLLICKKKDNFDPMQETKLYQNHSAEYCEYLEMI